MTDEERQRMMDGVQRDNRKSWGGFDTPHVDAVHVGMVRPTMSIQHPDLDSEAAGGDA